MSLIPLLFLFIFSSFRNIESSASSFPVKGHEKYLIIQHHCYKPYGIPPSYCYNIPGYKRSTIQYHRKGRGDDKICESVTRLMENCGALFPANAHTRASCCRDVKTITDDCLRRNMNHEEIRLISIARRFCSDLDTESQAISPSQLPPPPSQRISPSPSPINLPKSPLQTPSSPPPTFSSPPNQAPPISSPPTETPSLPPKSSPLPPQAPSFSPPETPLTPEPTPPVPSSPPSESPLPPESSLPPQTPSSPPESSPLPPQTPSSPPESSPLPPKAPSSPPESSPMPPLPPESSPLPPQAPSSPPESSPSPQPTPDPTPHRERPANCLVSTVVYDSCDPKYPMASSNGSPEERSYYPENVSTGFMTDGAGCCIGFAMFTNNCNEVIKDLSFANQKVFDSLQRACTSPFRKP